MQIDRLDADIIINKKAPLWVLANTQLTENNIQASVQENRKIPLKEMRLQGLLGYEVDRMFGKPPDPIRPNYAQLWLLQMHKLLPAIFSPK